VHEGGIRIERLDDCAFRFVKANGDAISSDGCSQPAGDWTQLSEGRFGECWRGGHMDLGLAVDVLLQRARREKNVPAGTSS